MNRRSCSCICKYRYKKYYMQKKNKNFFEIFFESFSISQKDILKIFFDI